MGTRSATQTALAILAALLEHRTVVQSELAHGLGTGTETIRRHMLELQKIGLPLEREQEGTTVFWSVPRQWGPAGVSIPDGDAVQLVRHLARLAPSRRRDGLLETLLGGLGQKGAALGRLGEVVSPGGAEMAGDLVHLDLIEDSALSRQVLHMHYYSMGRGELSWRDVSVQRVVGHRFVAFCHRDAQLKWFRVDNVAACRLDPDAEWRAAPPEDVEAWIARGVAGFNAHAPLGVHTYAVSPPADRWVARNLPQPDARLSRDGADLVVTVETHATLALARHVLGLGGLARATSPELRALVRRLAEQVVSLH